MLYDTVILDSNRLRELPDLLRVVGYDGLLHLLQSGAVTIRVDGPAAVGQVGQVIMTESRDVRDCCPSVLIESRSSRARETNTYQTVLRKYMMNATYNISNL